MSVTEITRGRARWGLGVGTAIAAASVLALNTGGSGGSAVAGSLESPSAAAKIGAVQAAQKAAFSVLERPQDSGDPVFTTQAGPFGANLKLARSVDTPEGDVRVVPGNGAVCLRAEDDSGHGYACGPTELVEDGVLMVAMHEVNGDVTVYGLVPDDAGDVSLTTPDGTETLDVTDNVFSVELDSVVGASVQTEGSTGTYPVP